MRPRDAAVARRVVLQSVGTLAGGLALRPALGATHRRDVVLMMGQATFGADGFHFANYRSSYPFWAPSWTEVLAGRPLEPDAAVTVRDTLATTLAAAGFDIVLATGGAPFTSSGSAPALVINLPPPGAAGPLVVASAGPGSSDAPMNPLDIAPTVCGLVGLPPSPAFVGRDYAALVARPRTVMVTAVDWGAG